MESIEPVAPKRELNFNFWDWWISAPHRKKYDPDHPVTCAARETWVYLTRAEPSLDAAPVALDFTDLTELMHKRNPAWNAYGASRYSAVELAAEGQARGEWLTDEQIDAACGPCQDSDMARAYRREFIQRFRKVYTALQTRAERAAVPASVVPAERLALQELVRVLTKRPPDTVMKAERQLDDVAAALVRAKAALAAGQPSPKETER